MLKDTYGQYSAMKWKRLILPHRILFSQLAPVAQKPSLSGTGLQHFTWYNAIFCEEFSIWNTVEEHQEVEQDDYTPSPTTCPYAECCQKDDISKNKWQMQGESESAKGQEEVLNSAQ